MKFLTGVFIVLFAIECPTLTKIACIGNSITYGAGLRDSSAEDTIAHVVYRALTAANEVLIKPNDPNINYYGRFDFSNSSTTVNFNWPGSIIEASFPGPSIGVELNGGDTNYFNVEIDGVLVDSLKPSTTTHRTISTGLSITANHIIRITLRTNSSEVCSFGGLYLADGKVLAAKPVQPSRKMEFIGDSLTDADVVGEALGASAYDTKYFNISLAYSRLTSIAYHAQDRINFPANLSGTEKEIVVYDCSGRIERKLVTRKQTVSLCKDFGLAERMYIVKTAKLE